MIAGAIGWCRRLGWWCRTAPQCAAAAIRNARGRRAYVELSESELRATRTSDTVFIFGSGSSLKEIAANEWRAIAAHANTISFREFPRQSFIRADYHVTAEVDDLDEYAARLRENPLYARTVFVVQSGWPAFSGNNLIGRRLLREGARLFRYRRIARGRYVPPSRAFRDGLVHGFGSVVGVVNFAYLMGWRTIVLAGVDMYDKRYFWLPADQMRPYEKPGLSVSSRFTGGDEITVMLGRWRAEFEAESVGLFVYNPRSLLATTLPVYRERGTAPISTAV
jgi:hypothetical protein